MKASESRGRGSNVSTFAILVAFLFANLLSAAPQLHEKIHGPSQNHECAVTLVATGKLELGASPPLSPAPDSIVELARPITRPAGSVTSLFLNAAIFEHAPPAVS